VPYLSALVVVTQYKALYKCVVYLLTLLIQQLTTDGRDFVLLDLPGQWSQYSEKPGQCN